MRTVELAEMLSDFEHQAITVVVGFQRVEDRGQMIVEVHVDDGADNLCDTSDFVRHMALFTKLLTAPRRRR